MLSLSFFQINDDGNHNDNEINRKISMADDSKSNNTDKSIKCMLPPSTLGFHQYMEIINIEAIRNHNHFNNI